MATIKFVSSTERNFVSYEERAKSDRELADRLTRYRPGGSEGTSFVHHPGTSDEPQLFEVKLPAGCKVDAHAHDADEIIVVTEGEVHFGRRVYGVGSSVFVPKMTLYSFEAGPEGLTFLNFRPRRSSGAILKDELMALRGEADQLRT